MDAATLTAIATAVLAVMAIVSTWLLYRQVEEQTRLAREEARRARFTTAAETVWHLDDRWDSPPMVQARRRAAASLLAHDPTKDVDHILDFFEFLALLTDREVLDPHMAWHSYYWPLVNYWRASQGYVQEARQLEGETTWEDVGRLLDRLHTIEASRESKPASEVGPSPEQMQLFLRDETELPEGHP